MSHPDLKLRAAEAVALWHENGLTVEFLEGMTYNHRVALVEVAREHLEGCLTPPSEEEVEAAAEWLRTVGLAGVVVDSQIEGGFLAMAEETLLAARRVRGDI